MPPPAIQVRDDPSLAPIGRWNRRRFLRGATGLGLAGVAGGLLAGCGRQRAGVDATEPPIVTTVLRMARSPAICYAPQYLAAELLQGEGFTEVEYVGMAAGDIPRALASGDIHMNMVTSTRSIPTGRSAPISSTRP